jgi:protein-L-isoaspartate O-methyltransferase
MVLSNYRTALLILLQQTDLRPSFGRTGTSNPHLSKMLIQFTNFITALRFKEIFKTYQEKNQETSRLLAEAVINYNVNSVLDIGCGIAGYHSGWMKNAKGELFLFDKSTFNLSSLRYGMGATERYYNSLNLAKNYLARNGIEPNRIHTIEIDSKKFSYRKYDLIVSFISLGFHYHIDTYWIDIIDSIADEGLVIIDIRNNSSSHTFIEEQNKSNQISVVSKNDYGKFTRYAFQKI